MHKITKKTVAIITILVVLTVLIINIALGAWLSGRPKSQDKSVVTKQQENKDYFSYKGKQGANALDLLKQKTMVEEAPAGFVISIGGRVADKDKGEYWAFYVNRKLATTGAADYTTKDGDLIEWKIEKY